MFYRTNDNKRQFSHHISRSKWLLETFTNVHRCISEFSHQIELFNKSNCKYKYLFVNEPPAKYNTKYRDIVRPTYTIPCWQYVYNLLDWGEKKICIKNWVFDSIFFFFFSFCSTHLWWASFAYVSFQYSS